MTNHPRRQRRDISDNGRCARHGMAVCSICVEVTDAGRRMSDLVNAMITFKTFEELSRGWMAIKLQDGDSDCVLYDTRAQAVKHVSNSKYYAFICMRQCMQGMDARDAQIYLNMCRHVYENGGDFTEPQSDLIMSQRGYDIMSGRTNPYI